jgi:SAM-dependent methyltransferase
VKGVLDKEYAIARQTKQSHIYRLKRRTFEVIKGIRTFHPGKPQAILDIGAADGLMLNRIKEEFPDTICAGIEYASDLISCNDSENIHLIRGDASILPFKDNVFDVVAATAIIEHLSDPAILVREAFRVLRENGIFIVTTPHPFWEGVATSIGHLRKEEHYESVTLGRIISLFENTGFKVVSAEQFMISPIGMPFEMIFERMLKLCGLSFLLLNQKIIGRKV